MTVVRQVQLDPLQTTAGLAWPLICAKGNTRESVSKKHPVSQKRQRRRHAGWIRALPARW
jgi:hypothetical protein